MGKNNGESDGKRNKGPKAGKFWGSMAEELVICSNRFGQ